jgi:hypothetical protein
MEHLLTFPNALSVIGTVTWLSGSKLVSEGKVLGWWLSLASLIPAAALACMAGAQVGLLGTAIGTFLTVRAIRRWSARGAEVGRPTPRRVSTCSD